MKLLGIILIEIGIVKFVLFIFFLSKNIVKYSFKLLDSSLGVADPFWFKLFMRGRDPYLIMSLFLDLI